MINTFISYDIVLIANVLMYFKIILNIVSIWSIWLKNSTLTGTTTVNLGVMKTKRSPELQNWSLTTAYILASNLGPSSDDGRVLLSCILIHQNQQRMAV